MGSCENLSAFDESLRGSVVVQSSGGEVVEAPVSEHCACGASCFNMIGADVDDSRSSRLSNDEQISSLSCANIQTTGERGRDGLVDECANVGCMVLGKVLDDEIVVSKPSVKENGVCNSIGSCLEFLDIEDVSVSFDDNVKSDVGNDDVWVGECQNLDTISLENYARDECGVCLNDRSEIDVCSAGGLSAQAEDRMNSLHGTNMILEETPGGSSLRNSDLQDEHMNIEEANVPSVEGSAEVLQEKTDICPPVHDLQKKLNDQKGIYYPLLEGAVEIREEKTSSLANIEKHGTDIINCSQRSGIPSGVSPLKTCVHEDDHKSELTQELLKTKTYISHHLLPSQCFEMPSEVTLGTGVPLSKWQDDDNVKYFASEEVISDESDVLLGREEGMPKPLLACGNRSETPVRDGSSEVFVGGKSDVSGETETELLVESISPTGMPSSFLELNKRKRTVSICLLSVEGHDASAGTEANTSNRISWSQDGKMPSTSSCKGDLTSSSSSIDRPPAGSVTEPAAEKSDITTNMKVETCPPVLMVEEASAVKQVSMLPCQPFDNDEDFSKLNMTDTLQKNDFGNMVSICVVDDGKPACHVEQDNDGVDCFPKTEKPDIIPVLSKRSKKPSRSNRKTQKKRIAGNKKNKVKVQEQERNNDLVFKVSRRKRSCFTKRARTSLWGLLDSINDYFVDSDMNRCSQVQNVRSGQASQKSNKSPTIEISGSGQKSLSGTRCLRLKVKMGKEVCQGSMNIRAHELADTTGSKDAPAGVIKSSEIPDFPSGGELEEEGTERHFDCFNKNTENVETDSDDLVSDGYPSNKDLDDNVVLNKSPGNILDKCLSVPAHKGIEVLREAVDHCYMDPGTSPDSEVINLVPDAQMGANSLDELHKMGLTSSKACAEVVRAKMGKKKDSFILAENRMQEKNSLVAVSKKKAKQSKKRERKQKKVDSSGEMLVSNNGEVSLECLPKTDLGIFGEETVSMKPKGFSASKSPKSDRMRKSKSRVSEKVSNRRKKDVKQEGNQGKSIVQSNLEKSISVSKICEIDSCNEVEDKAGLLETGSNMVDDRKSDGVECIADVADVDIISSVVPQQSSTAQSAWVRCDDCYKWRRIPVALANSIDENCRWVCKDNLDETYADCSTPQEKTNADINAELGISDCEEDASDGRLNFNGSGMDVNSVPGSAFWRIDSNVFLHRSRKNQTIDEIMVCHCKPPPDGQLGCGDECLNRILNIECVQGTCPCGDKCSNQQFQKRKYADMRWLPCGKKGFGLHSLEHISTGKFIIEYVGEVLDMQTYEARQKEYAAIGHKHFYFMTLSGSEVIDACAKGNLGRFINHSCDPNCRTEKWMVNGEICIGLFALKDIKEGEELTFDYNFVRVVGAAAKKCHCGSSQCRGYIGGDPQNTEVVYQGESDDEYPEPVMLEEGETGRRLDKITSKRCSSYGARAPPAVETVVEDFGYLDGNNNSQSETATTIDCVNQFASGSSQSSTLPEIEDSKRVEPFEFSQPAEVETRNLISNTEPLKEKGVSESSSFVQGVVNSSTLISRKSRFDIAGEKGALPRSPRIKTSSSSSFAKKGKAMLSFPNGSKVKVMVGKSQNMPIKPKKSMEGSSNGRFDAVQEKLNELLDADGGISKRKDAGKGYLKLLLLTAASGNSGEGIQSNRDLSMILDALLKTKSRAVLKDIIDKNGLQMLHNIMKQYRRDFKRIPILRKLLKVLEHLATRRILKHSHIVGGPPRPGIESFRASILSLTEHDDKQVHQSARNFRDSWIPKSCRKSSYMERDESRMDFHRGVNCNRFSTSNNIRPDLSLRPTEAVDCVKQSSVSTSVNSANHDLCSEPCAGVSQTNGIKTRKRKSRWDQPAETNVDSRSLDHKEQKIESTLSQQLVSGLLSKEDQVVLDHKDKVSGEQSGYPNCVDNSCNQDEVIGSGDGGLITLDDLPPGFSSPIIPPLGPSDALTTDLPRQNDFHLKCSFDVAIGYQQGKFISRQAVSYGIPMHIIEQFGSPEAETVDGWVAAPAMPFQPFPPLPPFPRNKEPLPASTANSKTIDGTVLECQSDSKFLPACHVENNTCVSRAIQAGGNVRDSDGQQNFKRMKGSSNDLGRRFFRQQKPNRVPPWLWRRNPYCSQEIDYRVDNSCSNFYQHPPQQNHQ